MRKRFRGNYPVTVSLELEGAGRNTGGQLYAGRRTKIPGETDGRGEQDGDGDEKDR